MKQGYTISALRMEPVNEGKEVSITKGYLNPKGVVTSIPYAHSEYKASVVSIYLHGRLMEDDDTGTWYYEINKTWIKEP